MSSYFNFVLLPLGHVLCECNVLSLYFMCCSVNRYGCLVCCVFDSVCELLVKQFVIYLAVFVIFLLNVMEVFSVSGGGSVG